MLETGQGGGPSRDPGWHTPAFMYYDEREKMEIENMSIKEVMQLAKAFGVKSDDTAFEIGKSYFIRTVTMYYTGRIVKITSKELVLEDAAWICDTGRFADAIKSGVFSEVEPYVKPVLVMRDSIVDATEWTYDLPKTQK